LIDSIAITAFGEKLFIFFGDIQKISCDLIGKGLYTNCSDKDLEEIKPNDEIIEKNVKIFPDDGNTGLHLENLSFKYLFDSKSKTFNSNLKKMMKSEKSENYCF
jgi:hypothetical protein